jgi:hypothetical protein
MLFIIAFGFALYSTAYTIGSIQWRESRMRALEPVMVVEERGV